MNRTDARTVAADPIIGFPQAARKDQIAALDRQTDAITALVGELRQTRIDFKPAADALHGLGDAQAKFCAFLVNNRLKLLTGGLGLLAAMGAISPNLAEALGAALKAMGLQ